MRPEDFRRAFERDCSSSVTSVYYANVVGGAACVAHRRTVICSRGIVVDDAANTVTFHLVAPDPEFLQRLALCGRCRGARRHARPRHRQHPLPATGPYEVASDTPRQITLVRNPYFHEWSRAAQPDGYPDRIVFEPAPVPSRASGTVSAALPTSRSIPRQPTVCARSEPASQASCTSSPTTSRSNSCLNTRVPPFNDIRVRRAINYAIDRALLTRLLGQDSHPTCQQLPPYIPGYQPYCPYTLHPNRAGTWSAPDLAKAKALIAASGTRGTPITIWTAPGYLTNFTAAARYLASLLDRLGYPTRIHTVNSGVNPTVNDSRARAQAFLMVQVPSYPAASEFLGPEYFSCERFLPHTQSNLNVFEFCDPRFDVTVREALAAEGAGSSTASNLWAKADRQFADEAPVVPLATPSITDFVSRRVGDYQYNPQLGVLIDQLWVH